MSNDVNLIRVDVPFHKESNHKVANTFIHKSVRKEQEKQFNKVKSLVLNLMFLLAGNHISFSWRLMYDVVRIIKM